MEYTFKTVGEMFELSKGRKADMVYDTPKKGTKKYLQINNIRGGKVNHFTPDVQGTEVVSDDLIIAWDGANAGTVGYGLKGLIGSTLARLRPLVSDIYSPFAGRFLQSQFQVLNSLTTGATIPHINRAILQAIKIPLPPLEEQKRIAAILDKADAIRRKRSRALQLTDQFLQSVFLHTIGPLASGYDKWKSYLLEQLAAPTKSSMRTGPFGSDLKHSEFVNDGICVLGIDNAVQNRFRWAERRYITEEKYEYLKRYTVYPKDVIITIMGTTGRSAVVPNDIPLAISTKHLATITVNTELIYPEFLSFCIHSHPSVLQQIKSANKGAIMAGLNLGIIKNIKLNLPPIKIQKTFVKLLLKTEVTQSKFDNNICEKNDLFDCLCQNAFKGEL